MGESISINRSDDGYDCTFYCGSLGADEAIRASGHEPNGYFWEGLLRFLAPNLAEVVELDSESGMFAAYGKRRRVKRMRKLLEPYLHDEKRTTSVIRAAESEGFEFDD
jgi:hypothetical protein